MERAFVNNLVEISQGNIDLFRKTTDAFLEQVKSNAQKDEDLAQSSEEAA
jgi:hypothetical protein